MKTETEIKEKSLPFSAEMIRAILEGRKTQTRRIIKPQPGEWDDGAFSWRGSGSPNRTEIISYMLRKSPYQVGGKLRAKETFVIESDMEYVYSEEELAQWAKDRPIKTEDGGFEWGEYHLIPHYRATEPEPNIVFEVDDFDGRTRWRPSIFMPQWASRIIREITEVRVEKLQEITEEGAIAEGMLVVDNTANGMYSPPNYPDIHRDCFISSWDSLYDKRGYGWDTNCWVWVLSVKPLVNGN